MKRLWMVKGVAASLAGAALLATASNASAAACSSLTNPVVLSGSTAFKNVLAKLAPVLQQAATPVTIVYFGPGSCAGIQAVTGTAATGTGTIWDNTGTAITGGCDAGVSGIPVDIGISDVYPQTCVDEGTLTSLPATGYGDFTAAIQAMTFIVPSGSTAQTSISAQAAFAVLGWAGTGMYPVAPWTAATDTTASNIFIRDNTSGTETMIAKEIGLNAAKWKGVDGMATGTVITDVSGSTTPASALGIVAAQSAQAATGVSILAFQAADQACGYLPDSASSGAGSRDKLNVREGRYDIWGPEHFYTAVDGAGAPMSTAAKAVTDAISLASPTDATALPVVQAEIAAGVIPQCAMKVKRTAEVGAEMSFQPTGDCGCYFDANVPMGTTTCQTCSSSTDCTDAGASHCNYGYCEAM
jgi:ABC-type phosphate transport system substrate-binding protein